MFPDGAITGAAAETARSDADRASHIAIILVHGIGDLRAGSVTAAAIRGLRAVFSDVRLGTSERLTQSPEGPGATLHRTRLQWRSATIDLLEFHWADLSGKIRLRHPFKAAGQILGVIREFPSMAVVANSSTALKWLASAVGISFALLLSVWALVLIGSLIELYLWPDLWVRRVSPREVEILLPTGLIFSATLDPFFLNRGYYWSYAAQVLAQVMFFLPVLLLFASVLVVVLAFAFTSLRPLSILLRTSAASGALTILLLVTRQHSYTWSRSFSWGSLFRTTMITSHHCF